MGALAVFSQFRMRRRSWPIYPDVQHARKDEHEGVARRCENIVLRPSRKDPESRFILPAGEDTALAVPMEPPMTDAQRRAILKESGAIPMGHY